jgi:hypothetical protein
MDGIMIDRDGSQPAGSGACLENRWRRGPLVGSSPTASAFVLRYAKRQSGPDHPSGGARTRSNVGSNPTLSTMAIGSVGNRQTTLAQNERC